ncbi:MAG TPA: hypothetical protein VIT21_08780 [Chthoniobacterales bacterium]
MSDASPGDSKQAISILDNPDVDWSLCTWEGSEKEQLRVWSGLTFREKLLALEEMCDYARRTIEWRVKRGLPYIDPYTNEVVVPPKPSLK